MERPSLLASNRDALRALVERLGGRAFHADIARREVLANGVLDYAGMTALPAALRAALAAEVPILSGREVERRGSNDGTTKLLTAFPRRSARGDGDTTVETVHIPRSKAPASDARALEGEGASGATLCVSSQAGCPVGCPFCASGLAGLARNLEAHEIVEQYVRGRALGPLGRSVVMGIGEPFLNLANLTAALAVVADEMGLGARKLTVSTVGFPDRLRRAARENPRFQLAISLHTPDQEQRDELVPAMKGVPIEDVLAAGDDWFEVTGREVTYEYVLLGGTNDSLGAAERLAQRLARRRCSVNLIPYNPSPEMPFARPAANAADAFRDRLRERGIVATIRWSRGLDGAAACGQLRLSRPKGLEAGA
ncbi:MAG: 23S rRNA (adenine(2503)-C(2))-methyltransferase RlmN [Planctomycetota bacterium]